MLGSVFVTEFAKKGITAWEGAALELARSGGLVPWPYVPLTLVDGDDTLVLAVQSDVLAVGTFEDRVRLPLTPGVAQSICNLSGALLPTPWLEYAIWRAAAMKLTPHAMVPNLGANLEQYAAHSRIIDEQLAAPPVVTGDLVTDRVRTALRYATMTGDPDAYAVAQDALQEIGSPVVGGLVSGMKKGVVVANFYKKGKVLLFGWYRPEPDVFDNGKPMGNPDRQPIQPKSNVHSEGYVDYSHGIRLIAPLCTVNRQVMETAAVYAHPQLSRLVNRRDAATPDGPVATPRYPSPVPPLPVRIAAGSASYPAAETVVTRPEPERWVPNSPDPTELALAELGKRRP